MQKETQTKHRKSGELRGLISCCYPYEAIRLATTRKGLTTTRGRLNNTVRQGNNRMKAKWGKASILCFILSVLAFSSRLLDDDRCGCGYSHVMSYLLPAIVTLIPSGLALGFFGATNAEQPKAYCYFGFFLNLSWFLLALFSSIRDIV